ncbi:N-acetylmuramic acid 6-phosphate etherase [Alkalimonas collagenimarina]|uniref:N-acetylmuramic acid 6-phosphate etherase n=1 Tax=Alkalimonas collagenimarina TaxID=400390 RepID=A0ABT9H056_9GAMM|nr:N-acetylmuramic acid 6-phosphate etherase [Alkalimonas collagenimarina]MDP4536320.1 N-acetylmuramic acid 6-phosphate etherase [Alkalimonas collagenimarina]
MNEHIKLVSELEQLVSESRNPDTLNLDELEPLELLEKINAEDHRIAPAIQAVLPQVAEAVDNIVHAFGQGGRLIYLGAGTSGRLGVLDAVECPPTFSVSPELVIGIIAGGDAAIHKAVEGAEDDIKLGIADLKRINFSAKDVLVGIAASGRTPYVTHALSYARELGAATVAVTCNPGSAVTRCAEISICPVVGPEVLTGSTRMKSGTAQKMVLNMLTTASMIRCGKVYQNLMVDVSASNQKLYARAVRIVAEATGCTLQEASEAVQKTGHQTKLAILHVVTGLDISSGQQLLDKHHGRLRSAILEVNHG